MFGPWTSKTPGSDQKFRFCIKFPPWGRVLRPEFCNSDPKMPKKHTKVHLGPAREKLRKTKLLLVVSLVFTSFSLVFTSFYLILTSFSSVVFSFSLFFLVFPLFLLVFPSFAQLTNCRKASEGASRAGAHQASLRMASNLCTTFARYL